MSQLPGARHRTMAFNSVLREGDILAMERANAALLAGAHGLREDSIDLLSGVQLAAGWDNLTSSEEVILYSLNAAAVIRYPIHLLAGAVIASVDVWIRQAVLGAPLTMDFFMADAQGNQFETIVTDANEVPPGQYFKKSIGLINASRDRALGLSIPSDYSRVPELRITSGSAADRITGVSVWHQRPPQ